MFPRTSSIVSWHCLDLDGDEDGVSSSDDDASTSSESSNDEGNVQKEGSGVRSTKPVNASLSQRLTSERWTTGFGSDSFLFAHEFSVFSLQLLNERFLLATSRIEDPTWRWIQLWNVFRLEICSVDLESFAPGLNSASKRNSIRWRSVVVIRIFLSLSEREMCFLL